MSSGATRRSRAGACSCETIRRSSASNSASRELLEPSLPATVLHVAAELVHRGAELRRGLIEALLAAPVAFLLRQAAIALPAAEGGPTRPAILSEALGAVDSVVEVLPLLGLRELRVADDLVLEALSAVGHHAIALALRQRAHRIAQFLKLFGALLRRRLPQRLLKLTHMTQLELGAQA